MEAMLVLLPISFLLAFGGLMAFVWAVRSGQFSDLKKPADQLVVEDRLRDLESRKES